MIGSRKRRGLITLICCFSIVQAMAQAPGIFLTRKAHISFYSSAPIEDIQAQSDQAVSAINTSTGDIYFKVRINSFQFPNGLMQEHFNDDYLESEQYPYAEFKGKISDPAGLKTRGRRTVTIQGNLTIHSVTRPYTVQGDLSVDSTGIAAHSIFNVSLKDHGIKIPTIVMHHIAEVVKVTVTADYLPATGHP